MNLINPHELVGNSQWVFWNEWPEKKPLEFELIDYFKAPVVKKKRGAYVVYYAKAITPIENLGVKEGDDLILFITFKAYVSALNKLRAEIKVPCSKKFADGKNLYIKIEKVCAYSLKIHNQEIRDCPEEQKIEALKQYEIIKSEQGYREGENDTI